MEQLSPSQRMSEGHRRPRSRRPRGGGVTGRQDGLSAKSGEQGLPRRLVVHRMGMRHGHLVEIAEATLPGNAPPSRSALPQAS